MLFCKAFVFELTVLLTLVRDHYSSVVGGARYRDERVSLSVCLRVCLSASISPELPVSSLNFSCMLLMVVTRYFSGGGDEIRYVGYFRVMDAHILGRKGDVKRLTGLL